VWVVWSASNMLPYIKAITMLTEIVAGPSSQTHTHTHTHTSVGGGGGVQI
jgi:hypothetical protein